MGQSARDKLIFSMSEQIRTWEQEIGKDLSLNKPSPYLEKLIEQFQNSSKVIESVHFNQPAQCESEHVQWISHNNVLVGSLQVCFSKASVLKAGFNSPMTWSVALIGLVVLALFFQWHQQRQYQEQILASEVKAQKEVADWSRRLCHDMRSPLHTLENLQGLLHQDSGDVRDLLSMATQRLKVMTQELSEKAQVKYAKQENQFNLEKLLLDYQWRHSQIHWRIAQGAEEIFLSADWVRIFSNIIQNSIEATQEKSEGQISVSWKQRESHITFHIADNGRGMPKEILQKLGQEKVTHGKSHGNGLGLFSSLNRVKELQGTWQCYSQEEVGTTFEITVPRSAALLKIQA